MITLRHPKARKLIYLSCVHGASRFVVAKGNGSCASTSRPDGFAPHVYRGRRLAPRTSRPGVRIPPRRDNAIRRRAKRWRLMWGEAVRSARAIGIQGVSQENAGAKEGKKDCDCLGHRTHPYLLPLVTRPDLASRWVPRIWNPQAAFVMGLGFKTFSSAQKMTSSVFRRATSCGFATPATGHPGNAGCAPYGLAAISLPHRPCANTRAP
jgi:hypothetical protein